MKTTYETAVNENGTCTIYQVISFDDGWRKKMKVQTCNNAEQAKAVIATLELKAKSMM